jgi:hypothetical protein
MCYAPTTMARQLHKSKEADDKEGGEEAELRTPRSFDFEDERKPFILMEKTKFFIHEEVEYFKKEAVGERTDNHSWGRADPHHLFATTQEDPVDYHHPFCQRITTFPRIRALDGRC